MICLDRIALELKVDTVVLPTATLPVFPLQNCPEETLCIFPCPLISLEEGIIPPTPFPSGLDSAAVRGLVDQYFQDVVDRGEFLQQVIQDGL